VTPRASPPAPSTTRANAAASPLSPTQKVNQSPPPRGGCGEYHALKICFAEAERPYSQLRSISPPLYGQEHGAAVAEFLGGAKAARLFAYVDGGDALVVSQATPPAGSWSKLLAFVRDPSHAADGGDGGALQRGRVGTFHHVILQSKHQLMTASMVYVTNLTPPGSDNASRAHGKKHQLMTAGMVRVTNLTPPGSE
jgi:hypothetical protein